MRTIAIRLLVAVALAAAALTAVGGSISGGPRWSPDGLFYQARVYELRDGIGENEALRKAFQGPLGAHLRAIDPERSGSPQWVAYNARFYERRLTVPLLASLLTPVAGDRAILDVSLAGFVLAILAVFWLLLALGFRLPVAAAVALATAFVPTLTLHASLPLTDSLGLALEAAALAIAVTALRRRDRRWLVPWMLILVALGFTRDSAWIPALGACVLAVMHRSRLTNALAATGVGAALIPVLLVPVPMRELLAQMTNGLQPAPDDGWGEVLGRYPGSFVDMLQADGGAVRDGAWFSAAYLLAGLALLLLFRGRYARSDTGTLMLGAAAAGVAYVVAIPVFSAFRLEIVLIPMAAFGLALGAEALLEQRAERSHGRARGTDRRSRTSRLPQLARLGSDRP